MAGIGGEGVKCIVVWVYRSNRLPFSRYNLQRSTDLLRVGGAASVVNWHGRIIFDRVLIRCSKSFRIFLLSGLSLLRNNRIPPFPLVWDMTYENGTLGILLVADGMLLSSNRIKQVDLLISMKREFSKSFTKQLAPNGWIKILNFTWSLPGSKVVEQKAASCFFFFLLEITSIREILEVNSIIIDRLNLRKSCGSKRSLAVVKRRDFAFTKSEIVFNRFPRVIYFSFRCGEPR